MSRGHYPRYILLQVDSPGSKREIAEGESLEEIAKKVTQKAGVVDVDGYEIPEGWTWHPLHPDNPLGPEARERRRDR